jgi:hypothetical protein
MIFVILVYVYPLKLMMASFFHYISGGWFPSEFLVDAAFKMSGLVVVYGIGVALLAGLLALLYRRSQAVADTMKLNEEERLRTRLDLMVWSIHSSVGLLSALFAWLLPERIGVYGGFVYFLLPATVPFVGIHFGRRIRALGEPLKTSSSSAG